jgi:DNA polymerase III alpha subunit
MSDNAHADIINDSATRTAKEARSMSVFCHEHPLASLRPTLESLGIVTAADLHRIKSGKTVRVTGMMVIIHMPPTRSRKRVIFVTMEDETGLMDLVVFQHAQSAYARDILNSEILTVEGKLQRHGRDGLSISIIVEKVVSEWTGLLTQFLPKPNEAGEPAFSSHSSPEVMATNKDLTNPQKVMSQAISAK